MSRSDGPPAIAGALWVVATPIGNLGDLSARAAAVLGAAEVIACEDTRRTGALLRHLGIARPELVVVNDHTERSAVDRLVDAVAAGRAVALVSDAGTPAVSDPGHLVVRAVLDAGLDVDVVPGPSAAVTALVASGLPTDRFCFEGFLPRKGPDRSARLAAIAVEARTTVLYEAPHRVLRTVEDLAAVCPPGRPLAIARELTKLHQEVWRGRVTDASAWLADHPPRGEFVLVLGGVERAAVVDGELRDALGAALAGGATRRDAVAEVAAAFGVPKRRVFDLLNG